MSQTKHVLDQILAGKRANADFYRGYNKRSKRYGEAKFMLVTGSDGGDSIVAYWNGNKGINLEVPRGCWVFRRGYWLPYDALYRTACARNKAQQYYTELQSRLRDLRSRVPVRTVKEQMDSIARDVAKIEAKHSPLQLSLDC